MKAVSILLLVSVAPLAAAQLLDAPRLVDAAWLERNHTARSLRILDARDLPSYLAGHVPGSVFLNPETLRFSDRGVPATLFAPAKLATIYRSLGIGPNTDVVIYSSSSDNFAASTYVATVLESLGHRRIAVLDGGYETWTRKNGKVDTLLPSVRHARFNAPRSLANAVDAPTVRRESAGWNLFDARVPALYDRGHLPGAKSLALARLLTDGEEKVWKSPAALREEMNRSGYDPAKPTVTYCTTGREASMLYFTLRHVVGIPNVRIYYGSYLDWTARKLPFERIER